MNRNTQAFIPRSTSCVLAACASLVATVAQAQLPPTIVVPPQSGDRCQPPQPSEFLLLVVTRTPDSQGQVQQLLPPNTAIATCNYLDDTVTRVGGFRTVERANAWARYISESTGLAAYVARPAETPTSATPSAPQAAASSGKPATTTATSYNPKPLGSGFAVLVNYYNKPEIAAQVQQVLGKEVGLAAYGQSPYLLALYTIDSNAAYAVLQNLTDRGFWATLVDSRRVVLLRPAVAVPRAASNK